MWVGRNVVDPAANDHVDGAVLFDWDSFRSCLRNSSDARLSSGVARGAGGDHGSSGKKALDAQDANDRKRIQEGHPQSRDDSGIPPELRAS